MLNNETIIALATPNGKGAISVIRISGSNAIASTEKFFKSKNNKVLSQQSSHTVHLGYLLKNKNELDEVLITLFKGPHSYTGEDTIEISCHGSSYIQKEIIDLFIENGVRVAKPGEFTLRAFINGKMDLNQAEAVADLIASENKGSHNLAMQQMKSGFSNDIGNYFEELLSLSNVKILGLMSIPPFTEPARPFFVSLRKLRDRLESQFNTKLPYLSMGMSGDFEEAIAEGSTHVRIGTSIFGKR